VLLGNNTLTLTQAQSTFSGQITGTGGLTVAGGDQTLSGSNSYAGPTIIQAGASLNLAGGGSISSSAVQSDGLFDIRYTAGDVAIAGLTGAGQVNLGIHTLTLAQAQGTFSGQITGTGGLTVAGGSQTLSGANDFSGQTQIAAGASLALSGAGSLAHSSGVRADGAWDIGGAAGDVATAGLTGAGQVNLGARTLTLTQAQGTFSGQITGTGGLAVAGGDQTLSGANDFSGQTQIAAGASLALSGAGSLAHSSGVRADGTWDIGGAAGDVAIAGLTGAGQVNLGARTLTLTQAQGTFSGQITGTGGLTVAGGTQTLSGSNSYAGPTTIQAGASLNLAGGGSISSSAVQSDGLFDVRGTAGDVAIAGLTGAGQVSLGANTLTLTQAQGTFSGQITGAGGLTLSGGTQTLSGSNSYTGNTTIHSGTLIAAHSNAVGSGAVRIEGGVFSVESGVQITNAIMLSGGGYQRAVSGNLTSAVNATSLLGGVDTTAQILGGSSGSTTLITSFSDASDALNDGIRRSDVYSFQGTGTSVFVLELSFVSPKPDAFLAWLNGENQWVNAVEGNLSGTNNASAAQRGFAGGFSLFQNGDGESFAGYGANLEDYIGAWGVEMSGGTTGVWAVLNHNSDFAAVPEPAPCLPVALACFALPLLCRKRRHTA